MLPYAGYVDPESTLAIGVHHDGHLEATERTFCSLYHTFMFGFTPFAQVPSNAHWMKIWSQWCTHQIGGQRIAVFAGVSGYSRQISVGNAPVCDLSVAYWGIMDLSVVYEGAQLIIWSLLHQYRIKNYQIDHL